MRWYITFQICLCHAYNCSKYKSHFTVLKDKRKEIEICLFAFQLHTLLNIFHSLACKCITLSKHYNVSSVKVIHFVFVPLFQPHTLASKQFMTSAHVRESRSTPSFAMSSIVSSAFRNFPKFMKTKMIDICIGQRWIDITK